MSTNKETVKETRVVEEEVFVTTCDRCGKRNRPTKWNAWGVVHAEFWGTGLCGATDRFKRSYDLCDDCSIELQNWFSEPINKNKDKKK